MRKSKILIILAFIAALSQSCGINSNVMWKQAKGTEVNSDSIPISPIEDYKLSVDDKISFHLTTNKGAVLIEDMSGLSESRTLKENKNEFEIRRDGTVELPKIGKVNVAGLTIESCEDTLVSKYSKQYMDPFIQVRVTNQRVIVFPGNGSDAKVVPLVNTNTTLMEAIAAAGGITERGKANTVKLMRKVNGKREVYIMDLSVIEGLRFADMIVQANDYIYVEPTPEVSDAIVDKVVPVISLLSSAIFIISAINLLK